MPLRANLGELEHIRVEDIDLYVEIFRRLTQDNRLPNPKTWAALLREEAGDSPIATKVSQLRRISRYVAELRSGELPKSEASQGGEKTEEKTTSDAGLYYLFAPDPKKGGGLAPTQEANWLYEELTMLHDVYEDIARRLKKRRDDKLEEVGVGASQDHGMFFLPTVFGNWDRAFGSYVRLRAEINNTRILLPRLNAKLLHCVFGYGNVNRAGVKDKTLAVAFSSFNFASRMVLIAHRWKELLVKNKDVNEGYRDPKTGILEEASQRSKKLPSVGPDAEDTSAPFYRSLREIDPAKIHFGRGEKLILAKTKEQPEGIDDLVAKFPEHVRYVETYAEAKALVRMGVGVAIVPEIYCKTHGVNAFRLTNDEAFTRYSGVYYSTRYPMKREVFDAVEYVRRYVDANRVAIRGRTFDGKFHESDEREILKHKPLRKEPWQEIAEKNYPL